MDRSKHIAFIGLGVMGGPMTGHLARTGYTVTAYNRSPDRARKWAELWANEGLAVTFADSPAEAARGADIAFTCVGNDADLLSVLDGDHGVLAALPQGALLVDHTTTSAKLARTIAQRCGELDLGFVDAPVSGGQAGAENGQLAIMCGGEDADMARAQAALRRRKRKKGQGMRGLYLASRVSTFHRRGVALFQTQPYSAELCQTGNKGMRTCPCTCGQRQPG